MLFTRNHSVSDYFNKLRDFLTKLNEKFEFDEKRPVEFSPKMNEEVVLRIFLNNIDPNLASVIINKDIQTLREAYYTLENLNLIREKKNFYDSGKNVNKNNGNRSENFNSNNTVNKIQNSNFKKANSDDKIESSNRKFNQYSSFPQKQNKISINSGNSKISYQNRFNYGNNQRNSNEQEPMEIDLVQEDESENNVEEIEEEETEDEGEYEVNFLSALPRQIYR